MTEQIATERVFRKGADGIERLVAAPGDSIPAEGKPFGYVEAIDLEADTADAAMARGDGPPNMAERQKAAEEAAAERAAKKYASPLPKPGEEPAEEKAKKAGSVEDKAKKN